MSIRRLFQDWSLESLAGLVYMVLAMFAIMAVLLLTGLTIWQSGTTEPEQTVTHWVDRQGDVQRLCLAYKTGDHVDALSCDLIDPMTGDAHGQ
ncbi:hypothetical protein BW14_07095 [Bifidobacterium sp. UTBIF-68]|uniref:tight junction protein ZO-3 n=1 Tax=Bifidobacterium sp. UTBIF-68 TaxID=1465262 RepID=UPI00112A03CA|nr:tight junction protein ZO-3 [Bifidobacterium sp. UTBIF-68]TPF92920.1 hypothetical protein BW14_07095 [Bifidobacterium sp. UTBIF-68]